jgi:hypothetical protein
MVPGAATFAGVGRTRCCPPSPPRVSCGRGSFGCRPAKTTISGEERNERAGAAGRGPGREIPHRAAARRGGHGGRGRGHAPAPGSTGGHQVPAPAGAAEPGRGRTVRARGAGGGEDPERARGARDRRRRAVDRRSVHGDGVPRGARSGAADPAARRPSAPRFDRLPAPGLRGAGRGARERHRSPRSEAGQPVPLPPPRWVDGGEGPGFRHLQGARRSRRQHDADHGDHGLAAVHVAGAAEVLAKRRSARGHVGPRDHPPRDAHGAGALPGGHHAAALRDDPLRAPAAAPHVPPRRARRGGSRHPALPGAEAGATFRGRQSARPRPRPLRLAHVAGLRDPHRAGDHGFRRATRIGGRSGGARLRHVGREPSAQRGDGVERDGGLEPAAGRERAPGLAGRSDAAGRRLGIAAPDHAAAADRHHPAGGREQGASLPWAGRPRRRSRRGGRVLRPAQGRRGGAARRGSTRRQRDRVRERRRSRR